jgi:hypothetical protein
MLDGKAYKALMSNDTDPDLVRPARSRLAERLCRTGGRLKNGHGPNRVGQRRGPNRRFAPRGLIAGPIGEGTPPPVGKTLPVFGNSFPFSFHGTFLRQRVAVRS